jgi:hypothetical protein
MAFAMIPPCLIDNGMVEQETFLPVNAAHVQTSGLTCHLNCQARPKTRIVKSWSVGCGVAVTLKVDWSGTTSSAGAGCHRRGIVGSDTIAYVVAA